MKRLLSADRDWNQYFDMLTRLSEPELWEPEPEKLLGSAKLPELLARSQFYRLDNCRIYIGDTIQRNITHLVKKNTQFNVKIFNKSDFFSTFIFKSFFDFYRQHKTGVFQFAKLESFNSLPTTNRYPDIWKCVGTKYFLSKL